VRAARYLVTECGALHVLRTVSLGEPFRRGVQVWLALEEKGISYDTVFISLFDKPEWYLDAVPSAKVPAIGIHGKMVWESKDILLVGT
jgi:glutathione S-transferase